MSSGQKRPRITDVNMARAEAWCIAAHSAVGQTRKYTGEPYWIHPLSVAALIQDLVPGAPTTVIIAAMLHDVVDDTGISLELVREEFGDEVADLVDAVSDHTTPADGPRKARKAMKRERLSSASSWAKTIALADVISNVETIADHDPSFANVYLPGKRELLHCLGDGDQRLFAMATKLVDAYFVS